MSYKVIRTHEICAGHRVVGHESKCRHLHGHNYVFHFVVQPKQVKTSVPTGKAANVEGKLLPIYCDEMKDGNLDDLGRVIDFSVVKSTLCEWLENNWDHKFLHWEKDLLIAGLVYAKCKGNNSLSIEDDKDFMDSLVSLPFNPTAENLAQYMVDVIGPRLLDEHGVELVQCRIEETSKCHVEYSK